MGRRTLVLVVLVIAGAVLVAMGASSRGSTATPMVMPNGAMLSGAATARLAPMLAKARVATAKYATSLARAKKDGYTVTVTQQIPNMGWHFMNPAYTKFDVSKPPILVYVKRGTQWQLGAFEWVFTQKPAKAPLPGATYGTFGAACHYKDGTFVFAAAQADCAQQSPQSGAAFAFWHPDFVTLHLWVWYPNPDGVYSGMNPLVQPFNRG
ncbi:MAG TPA: hypothetical protein VGF31_03090 [Myxococcaceae bacterium]